MNVLKFGCMGDVGDSVVLAATIKHLGGGVFYAKDKPKCRPFTPRIPLIKRLFESQDYIKAVLPYGGEKLDYDFSNFRDRGMHFGVTLGKLHADYFDIPTDFTKPWLTVPSAPSVKGRIIVSKTARYGNPLFPWRELVTTFKRDMLFVGLPGEHRDFCVAYGQVDYLPTSDLYEVATAIAGSDLFIGNQSSPNAIAEGLKHPTIQEVCLWAPDCYYSRSNAIHCFDGSLEFLFNGIHFKHERTQRRKVVSRNVTPLGGWKFQVGPNKLNHYDYRSIIMLAEREFRAARKPIPDDLAEQIDAATFEKPEILPDPPQLERVRELIFGTPAKKLPFSS